MTYPSANRERVPRDSVDVHGALRAIETSNRQTAGSRNGPHGDSDALFHVVALYAVPVVVCLQPGIDWDMWWHLAVGKWIVEHAAVPVTDPFSAPRSRHAMARL